MSLDKNLLKHFNCKSKAPHPARDGSFICGFCFINKYQKLKQQHLKQVTKVHHYTLRESDRSSFFVSMPQNMFRNCTTDMQKFIKLQINPQNSRINKNSIVQSLCKQVSKQDERLPSSCHTLSAPSGEKAHFILSIPRHNMPRNWILSTHEVPGREVVGQVLSWVLTSPAGMARYIN